MARKSMTRLMLSSLALAVSAHAVGGTVTTDGPDLVIKTKGGLEVGTVDKEFSFKLNGRVMFDGASFDGVMTKNGKRANETYLRRARLEISGTLYRDFKYDVSRNFGSNGADDNWKDLSVSYTGFGPAVIKVGRFDPTFGLENATSSKWTTAIERSMVYEIAPWASASMDGEGIRVSSTFGDMLFGEAGAYRQDNEDKNGKQHTTYVMRGVVAPILEEDQVLHFGVDYGQRNVADGTEDRMRTRLSVRGTSEDSKNGNRIELGNAYLDGKDNTYALEAAYMYGPFSIQGEYHKRKAKGDRVRNGNDKDLKASGYYAQVAYTLTGESRSYKLDGGKFDKIKPNDPRLGAWEVFYRYDHLKVDQIARTNRMILAPSVDPNNVKPSAKVHTVGLNWYANEAVRLSMDYVHARTDQVQNQKGDKTGKAVTARMQYVF